MKYLNDVSYKDCVGKILKSLNLKQLLVGWSIPTLQRHTHKNHGGNYWFKEGDWTNAISPFTLIKII